MSIKKLVGIVGVLSTILAIGGVFLWGARGTTHTIVRTNEGYNPSTLTISRGDTIRFINDSTNFHWPASDLHPTHGAYPAFDPRRPVAVGESWSFRFDEAGVWKFHDHLSADKIGVITVE